MAEDQGERTEEATQSRREEFRKQGQVAFSRELGSALFLLTAAGGIYLLGQYFLKELFTVFQYSFGAGMVQAVRNGDIITALKIAGEKFFILILPVLGMSFFIGVGATVVQTGFLTVEDALTPDVNKLNPLEGIKKVLSLKNVIETVKSIIKILFVVVIGYMIVKSEVQKIPTLIELSVAEIVQYIGVVVGKLFGGIGLAMTILALGDFFFQKWDLNKRMMMTKQEVKEEHKSQEGDPLIKSRIRKIQREMSNRKMMDKVSKADVIITNPTHIAIALKYDENLPAPQLIAKGADLIAEKIKAIAKEHNIPIVENKPLARTIFKTMKLGQVIPRDLFVAVAEVLSYVYRLRRKAKR